MCHKVFYMEKVLIIVRGIPGCGKSTFANLFHDALICTADDYHMKYGEYCWTQENAHLAHIRCQEKVAWGMALSMKKIIVANTSTTLKEMEPYYELAVKHGYKVFSVIVENRMKTKNIHNVPDETIEKMKARFDVSL